LLKTVQLSNGDVRIITYIPSRLATQMPQKQPGAGLDFVNWRMYPRFCLQVSVCLFQLNPWIRRYLK